MQSLHIFTIIVLFTLHIDICFSKEQRYNPSNDFLLHENGGVAYNSKRDYVAQFPTLKTPSTQFTQITATSVNPTPSLTQPKSQPNGKRDYVAPQKPMNGQTTTTTSKPSSTGPITNTRASTQSPKRDYVAPQFPTLRPVGTTAKPASIPINSQPITSISASTQSPPKRDYVAPQFPTLRPVGTTAKPASTPINNQPGTGNVKDLINFYDNKAPVGPTSPKKPSYSTILQGSTGNGQTPQIPSTPGSPNLPSKPISFSSVVSNKGTDDNSPTSKPTSTSVTPSKPTMTNNGQGPSINQNGPTLPSSIANNNLNQGSNSKGPTDIELQTLSEELLKKDTNNAAKFITISYQEKTTAMSKEDKAPSALLTIAPDAWNILTVQKFLPLLDNYERDTLVNEHVTPQERTEENTFMDAVMATPVMRHLMTFLKEKGYVAPDPKQQRDFVKQMWFGLYSRGKGKISSSGFEHIFLSELKNGEVSGLHNWIYFSKEETANRINYLGYLKYAQMNDKGAVIKMHFNQQGVDKPVGTMFIGTSPEFEMAIYTLCYVTRADQDCNLKLGTKDVNIVSHNFRYRSKNYIGSAYPQI